MPTEEKKIPVEPVVKEEDQDIESTDDTEDNTEEDVEDDEAESN